LEAGAVAVLEVVGVTHVVEEHAGDADLLEQRELDLAVPDDLHVAAERKAAECLPDVAGRLRAELGSERERRVAADVVDTADQVALADRHAERIGRGGDADLGVDLEHERSPQRPVVASKATPADELVLAARVLARVLEEDRV